MSSSVFNVMSKRTNDIVKKLSEETIRETEKHFESCDDKERI